MPLIEFYLGLVFRAAAFATGVALGNLLFGPAQAADEKTCIRYGLEVAHLVSSLTNDADVAMAAQDRAYAYCTVIDYPPEIHLNDADGKAPGTVPAGDKVNVPGGSSVWAQKCAARYKSFQVSDGTVLRYRSKGRVPCPVPK